VTTGYQLALIYNLLYIGAETPTLAANFGDELQELEKTVALWKAAYEGHKPAAPNMLVHLLDQRYSSKSLKQEVLEGNDQLKAQYLKDVCGRYGFLVLLADLEYIIEGNCEGHKSVEPNDVQESYLELWRGNEPKLQRIGEVDEEVLQLRQVFDLEGSQLLHKVPLNECHLVQENPFAGDPHEEDRLGPSQLWGWRTTHIWRFTVSGRTFITICFIICERNTTADASMLGCDSDAKALRDLLLI